MNQKTKKNRCVKKNEIRFWLIFELYNLKVATSGQQQRVSHVTKNGKKIISENFFLKCLHLK